MAMRYTYAYKTSDGVRHEAAMEAENRDAVFAALRAKGIRPIKVVAADGSKANGEVRGVRKHILALSALCLVLSVVAVIGVVAFELSTKHQAPSTHAAAPRHQIYGDPVLVERFERGDFGTALTNRADQMLAWFAQPGKQMCPKETDPRRCAADFASAYCDKTGQTTFVNALQPASDKTGQTTFVNLKEADPREVRELKQIVNGMRQELHNYLANGNGTPRSYWRRLIERTQEEMRVYERTRRELENEKNAAVWEQKNEALRRLGLRTIPNHRDEE